jgi:uncharacterized protein YjlB
MIMKKLFYSDFIRIVFAIVATIGLARLTTASDKKDARVTQVIKDVHLLGSKSAPRPATVNDSVGEGTAVRTGGDSRAELTFTDQTITRLGSNTVFSYGQGAKDFDLASGAVLMVVPKEAGTVRINTSAATAAITGGVAMTEAHSKSVTKIIVIEGEACVKLKRGGASDPCLNLLPGDMLVLPPNASRFPEKQHVDLNKLNKSAGLINKFGKKLPGWANKLILKSVDAQKDGSAPSSGYTDPTGTDAIGQKNATGSPTPPSGIQPPPGTPPPQAQSRRRGGT